MAKWKLRRQVYGDEEFDFTAGEIINIGRGLDNTIVLSSIVISRHHCMLNIKQEEVTITDLQSSNGIYVGLKKIPQCIPYTLSDNDLIGLGWTIGHASGAVENSEKFVFKLNKIVNVCNRLLHQSNNERNKYLNNSESNTNQSNPVRKRKTQSTTCNKTKESVDAAVINLTDSESESGEHTCSNKKIKVEPVIKDVNKTNTKTENYDLQYEAFNVKQEYLGYEDNEPIIIDSDSDSESENWILRLSQSSPAKASTKIGQNRTDKLEQSQDSSYSQLDDIIIIPHEPEEIQDNIKINEEENILPSEINSNAGEVERNLVDGLVIEDNTDEPDTIAPTTSIQQGHNTSIKKAQMIEPLVKSTKKKTLIYSAESKAKSSSNNKKKTKKQSSSSKRAISNSQKEERKRKLKEIADKEKEIDDRNKKTQNGANKLVTNVKVTGSNRGAFLTDAIKATVKPMIRSNDQEKEINSLAQESIILNKPLHSQKENRKSKSLSSTQKSLTVNNTGKRTESVQLLPPLNNRKLLQSEKPVSKVEPLPPKKPKKHVRFSEAAPVVHEFEIEPGNQMKKIKFVRTRLLDVRQKPIFSLEKITLMKILRWNPQWLHEQINTKEPPPILGHNNPMAIFNTFSSHRQYIGLVGDLLLMEIWECLTQAHMRIGSQSNGIRLKIESIPPPPPQERCLDLINLTVNVALSESEIKYLPKVGEIMVVEIEPENSRTARFFFVHNIQCLPTPTPKKTFCINLYATYTDKMLYLKTGDIIIGRNLAYINKDLMLFQAMEYLSGSPLCQAILNQTCDYGRNNSDTADIVNTRWTNTLNPSQKLAVSRSVNAALRDEPRIQMVQGPPGTGKSSVICAIVMNYFYNAENRRYQDRGKILICATSNAAVDELVIRLLNIRQSLPKEERFRMVRVGRLEAMHARARDVSSQQLAQRDAARARADVSPPGCDDEILHLEAKLNMWKTQSKDAKDSMRVAYCMGKVENIANRIALLRRGGGAPGPQCVAHSERRIIDLAHIVVTTLASAQNHKMKGLKGRIALCIVDEAGQAIEPETLIPLTLDVTRLTLIGDPQQLPGFICSQRARQHGLGESLFSRLTGHGQQSDRQVVLLNQQYRMHPAIAEYPNRAFYDGQVQSVPLPEANLGLPPYTMLAIASGDRGQAQSGANEMEAWGVARVAAALAAGVRARRKSLAIITPYSAHRDLLRNCLRALQDPSESPVEVNTVDSFQGQERDVVVVSLARSHGVGFLTDTGRMNVMLTRARHALIVCLNPLAIVKNNQWQTLVDDARNRKVYKTLPKRICCHASTEPITNEEVLRYVTK